jgi:hypothetical protein
MARGMSADDVEVFRVTIEKPWGTQALGPYRTLGAARAIVTSSTRPSWCDGQPNATARIERGRITWEDVE